MTTNILWMGGEDLDFPQLTAAEVNVGAARAGYSRCSFSPVTYRKGTLFPGGAITSGWVTCRIDPGNHVSLFLGLVKSTKFASGIWVGAKVSDSSKVSLFTYDDADNIVELATEVGHSWTSGFQHKLDMQIISYGAAATINVYLDYVLLITYTGNVVVSGLTNLDCVCIKGNYATISEIIVADDNTTSLSLVTHSPNSAGDLDEWTGAYTDINEVKNDDSNIVYENTGAKNEEVNLTDLPAGIFVILGVKVIARAVKSADATINTLKLGIKSGGSIDVDAGHAPTQTWTAYERYMAVNPVTGLPFTISEINTLQGDLQSAA